jgi:hypothetical protein
MKQGVSSATPAEGSDPAENGANLADKDAGAPEIPKDRGANAKLRASRGDVECRGAVLPTLSTLLPINSRFRLAPSSSTSPALCMLTQILPLTLYPSSAVFTRSESGIHYAARRARSRRGTYLIGVRVEPEGGSSLDEH